MTPITLPGTIPGLLRRGSAVIVDGHNIGTVIECRPRLSDPEQVGIVYVAYPLSQSVLRTAPATVALDLSDPTSRIHAAWWVIERGPVTDDEHVLLFTVKNGGHVNRKGQEQLRDMVLRRTPALQDPA